MPENAEQFPKTSIVSARTYRADIYCGLRMGYHGGATDQRVARKVCQDYCDKVGLGVTFTETRFIYTGGIEPGVIVGLINYPRFQKTEAQILEQATELATRLLFALGQNRLTIVASDKSIMIERENAEEGPK